MNNQQMKDAVRQLSDSRPNEVYKALLEIRKKCPKSATGVKQFVNYGLVAKLLQIVATSKSFTDQTVVKLVDMALSVLSNVCMEDAARKEVLRDRDAIEVFVKLMETVTVESLQVRCCRCVANLTLSPASWEPLHRTPVVNVIVQLMEKAGNRQCIETCIRALRLLGQTGCHVDRLLEENAVCAVMKHIDDATEETCSSAVRCIASLTNHRCSPIFACQVIASAKQSQLLVLVSHRDPDISTHALQTLFHLADNGNFRPVFGNIGGIESFAKLLTAENSNSEQHILTLRPQILSTLCLCCKEAVNRVKLREHSVLEIFLLYLRDDEYKMIHSRIVSALVCFLYDNASFDILLDKGLVHVLVNQLNDYMDYSSGRRTERLSDSDDSDIEADAAEKESVGTDKHILTKESEDKIYKKPLSNTDICLSMSSEEALEKDIDTIAVEKELSKDDGVTESTLLLSEAPIVESNNGTQKIADNCKGVTETSSRQWENGNEANTTTEERVKRDGTRHCESVRYSIHSPTYEAKSHRDSEDYYKGTKCIERFSPPDMGMTSPAQVDRYSPLSTSTFYSPSKESPEYSPQYSPSHSSPSSRLNGYSPESRSSTTSSRVPMNLMKLPHYSGPSSLVYGRESPSNYTEGIGPSSCYGYDPEVAQYSESDPGELENDVTEQTATRCEDKPDDQTCSAQTNSTNKNLCGQKKITEKNGAKRNIFITQCETKEPYKKLLASSGCKKRKRIPGTDTTLENNILVLLSCVSQLADPTNYLVSMETIMCLLDYIVGLDEPMARAARLLSRVFRNPHCFMKLVKLNIPIIVYERLLDKENINTLVLQSLKPTAHGKLNSSADDERAAIFSESDRFSVADDTSLLDDQPPSKRSRISRQSVSSDSPENTKESTKVGMPSDKPGVSLCSSSAVQFRREYKGVYHKQGEAICSLRKCGVAFLDDLSGVADSGFGRGRIESLLFIADNTEKLHICLCMLFMLRETESRRYFLKNLDFSIILDLLEDKTMRNTWEFQSAVTGLSCLTVTSGLPTKLQNNKNEAMRIFSDNVSLNNVVIAELETNEATRVFFEKVALNNSVIADSETGVDPKSKTIQSCDGETDDSNGAFRLSETVGLGERNSGEENESNNLKGSSSESENKGNTDTNVCTFGNISKAACDTYSKSSDQVKEFNTENTEMCRVKQSLSACSENTVIFIVEGQKIPGSRPILSESSEIFSAMLEGHYTEAKLSEIPIAETSATAFEVIVHYLHNCDCHILTDFYYCDMSLKSAQTCIQVLIDSDMYFVNDLKVLTQAMLIGKLLNSETAFIILQYAILHDNPKLQKAAVGTILAGEGSRESKVEQFCNILDSDFCQHFLELLSNIVCGNYPE